MGLLEPNTGSIFWTIVTFILLLFVLKKYAWKPILKTLEDRENKIKVALYQAEQDQKDAQKYLEEQKELLDKSRKESIEMINESKKHAENVRKDIIEKARGEAEKMLEQAKQEIEHSKEAAINDVKKYAVDLSLAAAQKVLRETLTEEKHLQLIEKSVKELSQAQ